MSMTSSPEPMRNLIKDLDESKKTKRADGNILTPRQTEVLQCLAKGLSNKQIAYELGLSEGTVKIHITLLMRTLEVSNRVSAIREGIKRGILQNE